MLMRLSLNSSAANGGDSACQQDGEEMAEVVGREDDDDDDDDDVVVSNASSDASEDKAAESDEMSSSSSSESDDGARRRSLRRRARRNGVWALGNEYDDARDGDFCVFRASLFWFSYRRDFPELRPYRLTSDAGWGCMLRAAQMMLAHALRRHYADRDWLPSSLTHRYPDRRRRRRRRRRRGGENNDDSSSFNVFDADGHDPFTVFVANAFADYPGTHHPFSLPNMVAAGLRHDKLPGEWYGPTAAAHVLKDLVAVHARQCERPSVTTDDDGRTIAFARRRRPLFRVMVAQEGCVFKNKVEELMTQEGLLARNAAEPPTERRSPPAAPSHPLEEPSPLDAAADDNDDDPSAAPLLDWDTGLLLIVPLRLGLETFDGRYAASVARCFSLPQSVGVLGGRPRHALWFFGASVDGTTLHGLDPHTVQATPRRRRGAGAVVLDRAHAATLHCASPHNPDGDARGAAPARVDVARIDPSLAVGLYCEDREDFARLCAALKTKTKEKEDGRRRRRRRTRTPPPPSLFSVADREPEYNDDPSRLLARVVVDSDDDDDDEMEGKDALGDGPSQRTKKKLAEEEDEYVFL